MGVLSKVFSFVEQKLEGMFLFLKKLETTLYTAEFIWMIMGKTLGVYLYAKVPVINRC